MKIYKVYYVTLTYDRGNFNGYKTKGYYTTREKAEAVEATIEKGITVGESYIEEIEVEE